MYEVHKLTGAFLFSADGSNDGSESAGVVSRHRTKPAAEKAMAELEDLGGGINRGKYEIREATKES